MSFLDLCAKRQSCRNFSGKPVDRGMLEKCVEAARLAPSGCNSQPWKFLVVSKPELLPEMAKAAQAFKGINGFTEKAGAFIVIVEEHAKLMPGIAKILDSQYFAKQDIGGATLAICLEAADLGLGTCIIGMYDRPALCELLSLPADTRFAGFIAVGHPADDDKIRDKQRKPLSEVAQFF